MYEKISFQLNHFRSLTLLICRSILCYFKNHKIILFLLRKKAYAERTKNSRRPMSVFHIYLPFMVNLNCTIKMMIIGGENIRPIYLVEPHKILHDLGI